MSLRARLLVVLAVLSVAGLVVANIAMYVSLRSYLVERVDRTVDAGAEVLAHSLVRPGPPDQSGLAQLAASTPGVYIGIVDEGEVRWSPIGTPPGEEPPPEPQLPKNLPHSTFTTGAKGGGTHFRARVEPLGGGALLAVAAPLSDVERTLRHVVVIGILVSLAVIAAIVGLGFWLVGVGLGPLRRIEATAAAIAAGDLSRRIENQDERTEVGRLGLALNAMLGQIEHAFAERTASEERLRRFVGDASHELRTPLTSVRAYAELFERGARDRPDDLARAMAGIEQEAKRMGVLVDDLLLLARLDQGRPLERKTIDLRELTDEAVEVARTLEPGRRIELDAPDPVEIEGDPHRLRQVLDNLLGNVRAHTPPSATATVRVGREDGRAIVEVADDGPGMSPELAAHAFERFYRGDESRSRDGGGSGLGLAIVAAIAEAHGGGVTVSSEPGRGTEFRVSLPTSRPAPSLDPAPAGFREPPAST